MELYAESKLLHSLLTKLWTAFKHDLSIQPLQPTYQNQLDILDIDEPLVSRISSSDRAVLLDGNLGAELRTSTVGVVAERVADGVLRGEDQELVARHIETELLVHVGVVLGGLVARAAGTVETAAGVDAGGSDVAAVLARERVAGAAVGRGRRGEHHRGGGDEEGGDDSESGLHDGLWSRLGGLYKRV